MPLRERHGRLMGQPSEDTRPADARHGLSKPLEVAGAAHAVEYHALDTELWIEALEAQDDRAGAPHEGARVHHQHHGRPQPLRDLRGRSLVAAAVAPVEAAHHAFDQCQIGVGGVPPDRVQHGVAPTHPAVEIDGRSMAGQPVEGGVDEVGPYLERLHGETAASERLEETEHQRGLPRPARHAGDHDGGNARGEAHGERSETPADLKVAISPRIFTAALARLMQSADPVPSPSLMSRSRKGSRPRASST